MCTRATFLQNREIWGHAKLNDGERERDEGGRREREGDSIRDAIENKTRCVQCPHFTCVHFAHRRCGDRIPTVIVARKTIWRGSHQKKWKGEKTITKDSSHKWTSASSVVLVWGQVPNAQVRCMDVHWTNQQPLPYHLPSHPELESDSTEAIGWIQDSSARQIELIEFAFAICSKLASSYALGSHVVRLWDYDAK